MTVQFETPEISSDDKLWAALSYIFSPLIPIILLLMQEKKERKFVRFHAVQSLAVGVLTWILITIIAGPGFCFGIFLWIFMLYLAYKAYQGEMFDLPVITNFIKNQGWV